MSKVQVDTIVDKDDISAPTFSKGAIVTGVCTATTFVGALTGNADTATTATTTSGNAGGLTGTPNITVGDVTSANVTNSKQTTSEHVNVTGVGTFGSVVSSGAISGTTGTFTGDVDIADKIVHTGDTDTAIRFPDADTVTVETGGSERIRVTSAGRLGIGTDDPFTKFDIQEGTTGLRFNRNNNTPELDFKSNTVDEAGKIRCAESTGGGILQFNTKTTGGVDTERIRIGTSGEIGIAGANYGTSGQVLTSSGSGAAVSWADVSAGIWSTLASGTVTSGTTGTITDDGLSSTYSMYKIVFYAYFSSVGQLGIDITTDGGSTWTGGGWTYSMTGRESNSNWGSNASSENAGWLAGANRNYWWGEITFGDVANSSKHPSFNFVGGIGYLDQSDYAGTVITNMHYPTTTAFNGIRWYSATAAMSNVKWVLQGTTLS